jgi:NAD(P)-dependent dehydrogenase (short-subunit alcohol dehydrogenase family)
MPSVLIVGASRGIGLGLVREYRSRGWEVGATVRDPAQGQTLAEAGATAESVDVRDAASRQALAERLQGRTFDAVILNAGVGGGGATDDSAILEVLHANAVGPMQLARALMGAVKPQTGVLAFITSWMGSIGQGGGGSDAYRASKAALNSFARTLFAAKGMPAGLAVVSLHPGWVKTDMGGPSAPVSVEDSARGLADVIASRAGKAEHVFLDYQGQTIPW